MSALITEVDKNLIEIFFTILEAISNEFYSQNKFE